MCTETEFVVPERLVSEYSRAVAEYARLGITKEMERAVIRHLCVIGGATTCYGDDGSCSASCTDPDRPKCTKTSTNNCICTH